MTAAARHTLLAAVVLLAVGLFLLAGRMRGAAPTAAEAPARRPNVIMVVVDTLRADRLGAYGNRRGLTPFLDELAARGTVFAAAYANSSWTCPSVASLFTSRYPSQHHVSGFASPLAEDERTLGEALADVGYRAAAFSANFRLTAELGYAQGFNFWGAYMADFSKPDQPIKKIRGGRLREEAESWVTTSRIIAHDRPLFLYFQLMETHAPYEPPAPFRERFAAGGVAADDAAAFEQLLKPVPGLKGLDAAQLARLQLLYDGEVASADAELRRLFERLEALGVLRDALIIITADHGEEFGEHGQVLHGVTLYEPAIRIPLLMVGPGIAAGQVVHEPVALLDVAPTLLELAGLPPESTFEGRSLASRLRGESSPPLLPRGIISELEKINRRGFDFRQHARAFSDGTSKAIFAAHGGGVEIYDLRADGGETTSLVNDAATQALVALGPLEAQRAALAARVGKASGESVQLDDATKEKLRALGYHQ